MKRAIHALLGAVLLTGLSSCRPSAEIPKSPAEPTKESLYAEGHQLYLTQQWDAASATLNKVLAMDTAYLPALKDVASLWYERGFAAPESSLARRESLRNAFGYFRQLEAAGLQESEVYERLGELSVTLNDNRSFLRYARKYAERFPYERQFYNLGLAHFEAEDYASVVRTQKEALERFPRSNYVGGFYRQMGRAYMKMGRDQTAERTLTEGVHAVERRLSEIRSTGAGSDAVRRLTDDRVSMLLLLKKLHIIYNAQDKLQDVERQLKNAEGGK